MKFCPSSPGKGGGLEERERERERKRKKERKEAGGEDFQEVPQRNSVR